MPKILEIASREEIEAAIELLRCAADGSYEEAHKGSPFLTDYPSISCAIVECGSDGANLAFLAIDAVDPMFGERFSKLEEKGRPGWGGNEGLRHVFLEAAMRLEEGSL